MLKYLKLGLVISFTCLQVFCSKEPEKVVTQPVEEKPGEIVVVATGDFHAALDRAEGLASVISDLRNRYGDRMIYLDSGDQFQGSLEGNISKGKAVVGYFNLLQLDAASIGNHEFDYGPDLSDRITVQRGEDGMGALKARVSDATYPFLSANLIVNPPSACNPGAQCNALGEKTIFESHTILERGDKNIGIIGATTVTARHRTSPAYLSGATFTEILPVVQAEAKLLREIEKCDWVLLVVHAGLQYENDQKTLKQTELLEMLHKIQPTTIDAVIAGDIHSKALEVVRGIPVVQTGSSASHVGVLHLNRSDGKIQHRFDQFIAVPDTAPSFKVTEFMRPYRRMALERKRQTVATATDAFPLVETNESALGNLIASALLDAGKKRAGAQIALVNSGALRNGLPSGPITYSQLFKLIPFDDHFVVVDLTGSELRSLLEIAFSEAKGMTAVAGLRITKMQKSASFPDAIFRDLNGDGIKEEWERNLLIDIRDQKGNSIDNQKIYRLATLSYLAEGGDHQNFVYDRIPPSRIQWHSGILVREVVADYMRKKSQINPADYYSKNNPNVLTPVAQK